MYLLGLKIGLTPSELRGIPYPYLIWLIHRYTEMNAVNAQGSGSKDSVRNATDADIMALMYS